MQPRSAPLSSFSLRAFTLALLGCFAIGLSLLAQTATTEASGICATSIDQGDACSFHGSDSVLTEQAELGLADDGIAFEDSLEMFRVDLQQRIFGGDRTMSGPKTVAKSARDTRPNISPPLLV
jgi:hypothetical protein